MGDDTGDQAADHGADRGGPAGEYTGVFVAGGGALPLKPEHEVLLSEDQWAEIAIVSDVRIVSDPEEPAADDQRGTGGEMRAVLAGAARGWKQAGHPTLCVRCTDAVESGLVCRG